MKYVLALFLALFPLWSMAETIQIIRGAYICDTLEQLVETFDKAKPSAAEMPAIEGCGFLQGQALAMVEELPRYENRVGAIFPVRMTFPAPLGVQYGYSGFEIFDEAL